MPEFKAGRIIAAFLTALISVSVYSASIVYAENEREVIPGGQSIGVSLSYDGVYIDDYGDVSDENGRVSSPAKKAGLGIGEVIVKINGESVGSVDKMVDHINNNTSDSKSINVTVKTSDGNERTVPVEPARDADGSLKIGVWAKDAASGVGTVTYYDPGSNEFYAVGHEISDLKSGADIGELCGDVYKCEIVGVRKGERGTPGELIGVYSENKLKVGEVDSSSRYGVKGYVTDFDNFMPGGEPIMTAPADSVHEGEAYILANVENSTINRYSIKIDEINADSDCDKNIIFKVTDDNLIDKTGGIVRGMSGSPIIQDGCLIGAVTHVLINEPMRGYGVFIENMK